LKGAHRSARRPRDGRTFSINGVRPLRYATAQPLTTKRIRKTGNLGTLGRSAPGWQNGCVARTVPSSLTPNQQRWFKALIKNYQLQPIFLKKQPLFLKNPKQAQQWRNRYLDKVAPQYVASLPRPLSMNAIGWYEGEVVFVFIRGKIGPVLQNNAFDELEAIEFTPCKDSARAELKEAIRYNRHKKPLASEWNPGHRTDNYSGCDIVVSKHGKVEGYPHVEKLLQQMWGLFQITLPKKFAEPSTLCPEPFRIAGTGYTRLAVLKSAASAIHTDHANGPGFGSMVTLSTFPRYTGGTFCFVEFGLQIKVQPGDILIANTPKHWHCNIGPIKGLKYSVVAYFKKLLSSQRLNDKYRAKTGKKYLTKAERDALREKQSR
jgi:hypothetical protein